MPWTLGFALIVSLVLAPMNYYVWRKEFQALCDLTAWDTRRLRFVSVSLHVWLSLLPVIYIVSYMIVGRRAIPAFAGDSLLIDLFFSYPFWISLVILVQLFVLYALLDILEFTVLRIVPAAIDWLKRRKSLLHFILAVIIVSYSVVTIARDTWTVRVVEHSIVLPPQFKSLNRFRIAQISDVQGDGRTTPQILRRYVEKVNSLHPDMVFFAGDLVTSGTVYIDSTAEIMGGLRSRFGTVAAVGDHDMFSNKIMVIEALRRWGIRIVEDSTSVFDVDGTKVAISVVTYTYSQRPTTEKMERLLAGTDGAYKIFLAHQPAENLVQFAGEHGYSLFVAGHTHGGGLAFGIPGLFLVAPASLETRYLSGLYHLGQMLVSITNGLGFTVAPIRFNAPAEISILDLELEGMI
jgi:predicted MPP superfamily phosphohydrolase